MMICKEDDHQQISRARLRRLPNEAWVAFFSSILAWMGCSCLRISSSVKEPVLASEEELALQASSILAASPASFLCCSSIHFSRSASSSLSILLDSCSNLPLTLFLTSAKPVESEPSSLALRVSTSVQKFLKESIVSQNLGVNTSKWLSSAGDSSSFFSCFCLVSAFSALGARFPIIYKILNLRPVLISTVKFDWLLLHPNGLCGKLPSAMLWTQGEIRQGKK